MMKRQIDIECGLHRRAIQPVKIHEDKLNPASATPQHDLIHIKSTQNLGLVCDLVRASLKGCEAA